MSHRISGQKGIDGLYFVGFVELLVGLALYTIVIFEYHGTAVEDLPCLEAASSSSDNERCWFRRVIGGRFNCLHKKNLAFGEVGLQKLSITCSDLKTLFVRFSVINVRDVG